MPYVNQEAREYLDLFLAPRTEGELNYTITMECKRFLGSNPNYARFNTVIGVLECAKLEFYRRAVAAYEDEKIKENGDVF